MSCFLSLLLGIIACQPEEEIISSDPDIQLSFSKDTVTFDTIFSSVGSITKRFKVYNRAENALVIDQMQLSRGNNSPYSLIVNGQEAKSFNDVFLLGKDSLMVLVKVKIDPGNENLPFLVKDSVLFITNNSQQHVKLVSWGQDAFFIPKSVITRDSTWTSLKPIIIMDSILIDSASTLTIEKGSKIYAEQNAALLIAGSLKVLGSAKEPVLFSNSRLDIKDAFGHWRGILFATSSRNNKIDHAVIRNAINGIFIGTPDKDTIPDLVLSNTKIENMANLGLWCNNSDVLAYNILINNCVSGTVWNLAGGNYQYYHCTFANFSFDFIRNDPSVVIFNYFPESITDDPEIYDLNLQIHNSIIWGSQKEELVLDLQEGSEVKVFLSHNIIRTGMDQLAVNNNLINTDPKFVDPEKHNYHLDTLSPAKDHGVLSFSTEFDLEGQKRDSLPDLGAYERLK